MKWFLKRLGEGSSAAGLSGFASALYGAIFAGMPLSVAIPAAFVGLVAVLIPDKGAAR